MNIDEMQAGPETDRLVAERVMEWAIYTDYEPRFWLTDGESNGWAVDDFDAREVTRDGVTEIVAQHGVFRPSVDIAAAWVVLERIYEVKGNWICVEKSIDGDFNAGVVGDIGDPDWWRWATNAPTAPLAICRAALKAMGRLSAE